MKQKITSCAYGFKNIENYQLVHPFELRLEEKIFFKVFHLEMSKTNMEIKVPVRG